MRHAILLWVLSFVISAAGAQQAVPEKPLAVPPGAAVVADFKGEVTLKAPDGAPLAAQRAQILPANTIIEIGKGSMLLSLGDGSQVLIKAHTRVQLTVPEKSQGSFLQLFLGDIVAKVQKRLGMEPSFRMGTPTAVITVRGTRFEVEVTRKNRTIVEVYEGLVEVTSLAAPAQPVMVRPGFSTQVENQGPAEMPRSVQGDDGEAEHIRPRGQGVGNQSDGPPSTTPGNGGTQGSGEKPD